MARAKLNETTVRDSALMSLAAHYNAREDVGKVADQAAAMTNHDALRADGIVACRMRSGAVLCAAVETTSERSGAWRAAVASVVVAVVGLLATRSPMGLVAVVPVFFVVRALLARSEKSAVERVSAYPAHERWVALPADLLDTPYAEDVRSECRAKGIGVLRTGRSKRSSILDLPRHVKQPEDGVLARYRCAPRVLERLA